jgi:AcrR family transcriptional regulator
VEGVDGLSIGRLAEHTGKSKSGLFAHFGSKEELQLAAIDTAEHIFDGDVVTSARAAPEGLTRWKRSAIASCHTNGSPEPRLAVDGLYRRTGAGRA